MQPSITSWVDKTNNRTVKTHIDETYDICRWRKNLFQLSTGALEKRYIRIMTSLLIDWSTDVSNEIALKKIMCMPALLLQKTSNKTSAQQNKAIWKED